MRKRILTPVRTSKPSFQLRYELRNRKRASIPGYNWDQEFDNLLSDEKLLLEIAKNGQNAYKKIWTMQGCETVCERFIQMINPN